MNIAAKADDAQEKGANRRGETRKETGQEERAAALGQRHTPDTCPSVPGHQVQHAPDANDTRPPLHTHPQAPRHKAQPRCHIPRHQPPTQRVNTAMRPPLSAPLRDSKRPTPPTST
ncbi:hypothetical protein CPC08DRAFT_769225 [Agrocybe pediades]|nr:hypothetical protein CPC08DRAFT_769225 [Agrocybe pediades]